MEKGSFVIGGNRIETFSSLRNNKWLVIAKHGNLYSFNLSRNKDRAKVVGLSRLLMDYEEYELLV